MQLKRSYRTIATVVLYVATGVTTAFACISGGVSFQLMHV